MSGVGKSRGSSHNSSSGIVRLDDKHDDRASCLSSDFGGPSWSQTLGTCIFLPVFATTHHRGRIVRHFDVMMVGNLVVVVKLCRLIFWEAGEEGKRSVEVVVLDVQHKNGLDDVQNKKLDA